MTARPAHDPALGDGCDCFRCHIASVGVSPAALPTRRNSKPTRLAGDNAWERGVATHPNGMPWLDSKLDTIPLHEWQGKRASYERKFSEDRTAATAAT